MNYLDGSTRLFDQLKMGDRFPPGLAQVIGGAVLEPLRGHCFAMDDKLSTDSAGDNVFDAIDFSMESIPTAVIGTVIDKFAEISELV